MLLNVGSLFGPLQTEAALVAGSDPYITGRLSLIDSLVSSNVGNLSVVSGYKTLQNVDFVLAGEDENLLALVAPSAGSLAARYPNYARWASAVMGNAKYGQATLEAGVALGGSLRIGGQIDIRADPVWVSTRADISVERNAGQKKKDSQRAAEDAAKASNSKGSSTQTPAATSATQTPTIPTPTAIIQTPETLANNRALTAKEPAERMQAALAACSAAGISTGACHQHAPAPNVPELLSALAAAAVTGLPCKNLFLKAKKERAPGDSRLWLVVAPASAKTDLNAIGKTLGYPKDGVRFGDEETLKDNLGVVPGHVSPLCLFNDKAGLVNVVLDSSLTISTLPLLFHPFTNTASIEMTYAQLLDLLTKLGKKPVIMDFPTA